MDGCIYRTKDGECDLYSEGGKFHAFCCNMNSCEGRKLSNADRIRAMTDEELADWECNRSCFLCRIPDCEGRMKVGRDACRKRWLDWLQQEAKDGT